MMSICDPAGYILCELRIQSELISARFQDVGDGESTCHPSFPSTWDPVIRQGLWQCLTLLQKADIFPLGIGTHRGGGSSPIIIICIQAQLHMSVFTWRRGRLVLRLGIKVTWIGLYFNRELSSAPANRFQKRHALDIANGPPNFDQTMSVFGPGNPQVPAQYLIPSVMRGMILTVTSSSFSPTPGKPVVMLGRDERSIIAWCPPVIPRSIDFTRHRRVRFPSPCVNAGVGSMSPPAVTGGNFRFLRIRPMDVVVRQFLVTKIY